MFDPALVYTNLKSAWLLVTTIDNWSDSQNSTEIENLGFAPSSNLEPALISTLQPGIYMVMVMSGNPQNLDEGFVELLVKDMNPSTSIGFQNISMRGTVGSGNSINSDLNLKFETSGQSSMKLFSSALGQSLENYVIIDVVPDPSLYLYRLGTDETDALLLLENDDFEETVKSTESLKHLDCQKLEYRLNRMGKFHNPILAEGIGCHHL